MFRRERRSHILRLLADIGHVEVDDLASRFGVSADSIRKDLQALNKEGKLKRVYGGAVSLEEKPKTPPEDEQLGHANPPSKNRKPEPLLGGEPKPSTTRHASPENALSYAATMPTPAFSGPGMAMAQSPDTGRMAVAQRAYMELHDGDTVFLDISRTNVYLADLIAAGNKRLVVTTNMIDVLQRLSNLNHVTALGTGGYLNVQLNGFVGSATVSLLEPLLFNKAFIGASGIDLEHQAVTSNDIDSGAVKERVIHNASYKFLLADAPKFGTPGNFRFASLDDFSAVITDCSDDGVLVPLRRLGIPVLHTLAPTGRLGAPSKADVATAHDATREKSSGADKAAKGGTRGGSDSLGHIQYQV